MGNESVANIWNPAEALQQLKAEQDLIGDTSEAILTEQRFLRAAPIAADVIIHLAQYSTNERIKLSSAQYIVERVLGKTGDGTNGVAEDPFQRLLQQCVVDDATKGRALTVQSYEAQITADEPNEA